MALFEITHFWSNLLAWGYQDIFHFDGNVGPPECIFIAPLKIAHFWPVDSTHNEAPKRKNVAPLAL